jgi:hypothetical protein
LIGFKLRASVEEVRAAILMGSPEPVDKGWLMFRKNFSYNASWRGKHRAVKQVAPLVAEEAHRLVVVTVYVFYF